MAPATTLTEIVWRAETGWPLGGVPYQQWGTWSDDDGRTDEDGYRPDCSGFASMALGIPAPGLNTVTLATSGTLYPIPWSQMRAGDCVMLGGPGTAGDAGHVGVVTRVSQAEGWYEMLEQSGGLGPDRNRYRIGQSSRPGMTPYRSKYVNGAPMDPNAFPWPPGHVAGHFNIQNARNEYHGGQLASDRQYITRIQDRLVELGYDVGPDGADGWFGDNTKAAAEAWARATGRPVDGTIGSDDWAALFAQPAADAPEPPGPPADLGAVLDALGRIEAGIVTLISREPTGVELGPIEGEAVEALVNLVRSATRGETRAALAAYAAGGVAALAADDTGNGGE